MTFKPNIRIGVDWDGDGFVQLQGGDPLTTPSMLGQHTQMPKWFFGWQSNWEDNTEYTPLTNSPYGLYEGSVLLGDGELTNDEARRVYIGRKDPKTQMPETPEAMFDGDTLNGLVFDVSLGSDADEETLYGTKQLNRTFVSNTGILLQSVVGSDNTSSPYPDVIYVESGTTYTLQIWVKIETDVAVEVSSSTTTYVRTHKTSDGTLLDTVQLHENPYDEAINANEWVLFVGEWTPSFTGYIYLAYRFNFSWDVAATGTLRTTGFMMYESTDWEHDFVTAGDGSPLTEWVSTQFYSKQTWTEEDFYINLDANEDYTIGFYVKADVAKTMDYTLRSYEHTTTNTTDATGTFSVTTDWTLVELPITKYASNPYSAILAIYHASEDEVTLDVRGVSVYLTSEGYSYLAGSTSAYDSLLPYATKVDWQLGTKNFYDTLTHEGTLNVTLNNDSRIFSPANTSSPLYGSLEQNRKVVLQLQDPVTLEWTTVWSGWTDRFSTDVGTASNRKATIKCKQGVFRLREGTLSFGTVENQRIDEVIQSIVDFSGWRSVNSPIVWWVNENTSLGIDTFLPRDEDIWARIDRGVNIYELIGDGWNGKTKVEQALKDLLEAEDGVLWVNREGYLEFRNRHDKLDYGETLTVLDVGDLTKGKYEYGEELINTVEVFMKPKKEVATTEVWRTKERIRVGRGSVTSPILLNFEFEEGSPKTVENLQLRQSDMGVAVYRSRRRRNKNAGIPPTEVTNEKQLEKIKIDVKDDGQGRYYLTVENTGSFDVYVEIIIYGDYIEGGEGISFVWVDDDAISSYGSVHKTDIKTNLLTTEREAKPLAELRLLRNGYPTGEFKTIDVIAKDATETQFIINHTLGSKLSVSEGQTGESDRKHIVIAEKATYANGYLTMTYTLAHILDTTFSAFGDTFTAEGLTFGL